MNELKGQAIYLGGGPKNWVAHNKLKKSNT